MRDTTIAELAVFRYDLRYRHGRYVMSGDRVITTLPAIVVRVRTADGVVGYGEACPLGPAYLPGFGGGVEAVLAELGPQLIGADAVRLGELNALMDRRLSGHGYAKSAVDIACWDVLGKVTGLPVADLLGGVRQERFPLYVAIPLESKEVMVSYVRDRRAEGIHYFQLKLGGHPVEDAQRVAAVVEATDDQDVIVADANCGWKLQDATVAARLLEPMPRVYLEQPCATIEECLAVRRLTSETNIAARRRLHFDAAQIPAQFFIPRIAQPPLLMRRPQRKRHCPPHPALPPAHDLASQLNPDSPIRDTSRQAGSEPNHLG